MYVEPTPPVSNNIVSRQGIIVKLRGGISLNYLGREGKRSACMVLFSLMI